MLPNFQALARVAERSRLGRMRLEEHEATLDQESKQRLREQQIAAGMYNNLYVY